MAKTFTKIRKWAEEKGFKIDDKEGYSGKPRILVYTGEREGYEFVIRDSTIYMSIRGQRGNAGGLYVARFKPSGDYGIHTEYGFLKSSQKQAIEDIELELRKK